MDYRIGYGEDIHALVKGRDLILSGVKIPFEKGLLGHSDGDIVYHALADALLGSLGLGDIGKIFPPSDPATEGIDSRIIVSKCLDLVGKKGYVVNNADISIAIERPRLSSFIKRMRMNIADVLNLDIDRVSIKAMTNEGFDAVGKGEAARAVASVLVKKE